MYSSYLPHVRSLQIIKHTAEILSIADIALSDVISFDQFKLTIKRFGFGHSMFQRMLDLLATEYDKAYTQPTVCCKCAQHTLSPIELSTVR